MLVVLPAPLGPRKPWICPGRHVERHAVDGGEAAVALDEILDGDHRPPPAHGDAQQPQACRRGMSIASGRGSLGLAADQDRRRVRRDLEVDTCIFELADQRQDRRLLVEAAARQPHVGRVGRKLVERRIDRQPQAAAAAFVDVDLGPGVVVERAAHVGEADVDARRNAERSRQRHEQRGVLVAVADLGAQHFARRRQADGRLLVEQRVDFARQPLGSRARAGDAGDHALGLGADLRRVALDERLGPQVAIEIAPAPGPASDRADRSARRTRRRPTGRRRATSGVDRSTPISRSRSLTTSRGSSMRLRRAMRGTIAAASSMSSCIRFETASRWPAPASRGP